MNETAQLSILDCTLRDGSYPIQFQFTSEDTYRMVRGLDRAGIELIEVGHGLGLNAQATGGGKAAATDREYIEAATEAAKEAAVGVFYIPGIGRPEDIRMAADAGADFIRIGQNVTQWEELADPIAVATEVDLTVCGNLMKSYAVSPGSVADRCADMERWGADVAYIVDSAGGMLPADVEEYVRAVSSALDRASVGFHCHDNLDLALANTLQAIDAGAEWVDATLQGIGRSAGNTRLETLATVLEKRGYPLDVDQKSLMDLGVDQVAPLLQQAERDPHDITAGYALFHTKFLEEVLDAADEYDIDARDLMLEVSKEELVELSSDQIVETAREIASSPPSTALERQTSYLEHSRPLESLGTSAGDKTPVGIAREVDRLARMYNIPGVLTITPAFEDIDDPRPTVLHRSDQAVLGNISVANASQAKAVYDAVAEAVDTVAIDSSYAGDLDSASSAARPVWFDDQLAIARAIAAALDELVLETSPSVTILGSHPVVDRLTAVLASRGWDPSLVDRPFVTSGRTEEKSPENITSTVSNSDAIVAFDGDGGPVGEGVISYVPRSAVLIDAGIGSLSREAIQRATDRGVEVYRSDVRGGYISEVEGALITRELFDAVVGEREVGGTRLVAGGIIGDPGDVVVDSIADPDHVFGIADGVGGLKESPTSTEVQRMESIARRFGASTESY